MARSPNLAKARERVSQLFTYLLELHRVRTPPARHLERYDWSLPLSALPDSPMIRRGARFAGAPAGLATGATASEDYLLRVARPDEVACPEPPENVRDWLVAGWEQPSATPRLRAVKPKAAKPAAVREVRAREAAFEAWLLEREGWLRDHGPSQAALALFLELFDLWTRFERESEKYQLYLGDGILVAEDEDGEIRHPLLLQRIELSFEPSIPAFTLSESEDAPEIYATLLRHLMVDGRSLLAMQRQFSADPCEPLGGKPTEAFLKALVHGLWPDGAYFDDAAGASKSPGPLVYRDPVVYLGHRNQDFAGEVDRYLEALPNATHLPEALLRVVGIGDEADDTAEPPSVDPLLTQPANPEQERVIRRLEETGAVLVQGPPGTGKSHTIANLIGHLLAQNKTILVTSHTAKALRVVRDKVAEPLRSLCVSVLDHDEESARQLEESITGILNYLSSTTRKTLESEIADVAAERETARFERDRHREALLAALADEYGKLELDGQAVSPADVAAEMVSARDRHAWLPGPVQVERATPPLSADEIADLYALCGRITVDDERVADIRLPASDLLPTPEELAANTTARTALALRDTEHGRAFWSRDDQTPERLHELAAHATAVAAMLDEPRPFVRAAMAAGAQGRDAQEPWRQVVQTIRDCAKQIPPRNELVVRHGPRVQLDMPLGEVLRLAHELLEHVSAGKKLGGMALVTKPQLKTLLAASSVDSGRLESPEHVRALVDMLEIQQLRNQLARRWDQVMGQAGAPPASELGAQPEVTAQADADMVARALGWADDQLRPFERACAAVGLDWARVVRKHPAPAGPQRDLAVVKNALAALPPVLEARARFLERRRFDAERDVWLDALQPFAAGDGAGAAQASAMISAISSTNREAYAAAYDRLVRARRVGPELARRDKLLATLSPAAPSWARALASRAPEHATGQLPAAGDVEAAWSYRRWAQKLEQATSADLDRLQARLDEAGARLRDATARYVEKLAWYAQFARTALEEQQALAGWLALHKKIGKGTGKNATRLKEEAKLTLRACRRAVPVWIMPMSRVLESFDLATTRFDVVILDEASQCDITGLVAFALAKEVAVVGDHEQVSPYAVGHKIDKIQGLIDELLPEIPNSQLYDGKTSVYDLARQSFGGTIRLLEHFRCVPDIIQFSNQLCYGGDIMPLREASSAAVRPALVEHQVADGRAHNKINEQEAHEIAALVAAMCATPEYDSCTIGVISMVGTDQALFIDDLLRRRLTVAEYQGRRLLCGSAAQFQGDERDVILLSMVDSPKDGKRLAIRQREDAQKVFNVAASRARDQLWVVHSFDPDRDLKTGDLRLQLIAHARDPSALRDELSQRRGRPASELERRLHDALLKRGYRAALHGKVGEHVLDILVEGEGGVRAALQCDGGRPQTRAQLAEAVGRQLTLERLGWKLLRVRASRFFLEPDNTIESVCDSLAQLGIAPHVTADEVVTSLQRGDELLDRVRARATELRQRDPSAARAPKPRRAHTGDWS